jgi:hypothetical protein
VTTRGGATALAVIVLAVVALVVVIAIVVIDPPRQRLRSLDERRTDDLGSIGQGVEMYWTEHKVLPADLAELGKERNLGRVPVDPETAAPYEYEPVGEYEYRLCATFALDTLETDPGDLSYPDGWLHGAGRHCFDRSVERLVRP